MKKLLIVAALFLCATLNAQKLEISVKAGMANSLSISDNAYSKFYSTSPYGSYAAEISGTISLPKKFRVGASVAIYKQGFKFDRDYVNIDAQYIGTRTLQSYYQPIAIQAILLKRFGGKLSFDVGVAGGACVNNKSYMTYYQLNNLEDKRVIKAPLSGTTYTAGIILSSQYKLSKHVSVGLESQPKILNNSELKSVMMPVMVKISIAI